MVYVKCLVLSGPPEVVAGMTVIDTVILGSAGLIRQQ